MKIVMKEYDLKSFKEKDVYTWNEILDIIQDLESEKFRLEEELEDLKEEDIEILLLDEEKENDKTL